MISSPLTGIADVERIRQMNKQNWIKKIDHDLLRLQQRNESDNTSILRSIDRNLDQLAIHTSLIVPSTDIEGEALIKVLEVCTAGSRLDAHVLSTG